MKANSDETGGRYLVVIEPTEDGFGGYAADLPDCVAVGATVDDVCAGVRDAIAMRLRDLRVSGGPDARPLAHASWVEVRR